MEVTRTPLQELFGINSVTAAWSKPAETPAATSFTETLETTLAAPDQSTPIDPAKLQAWEGIYFDTSTGEGVVRQDGQYLRTGWYFERASQQQPTPGGSLEDRSHAEALCPFGFLTQESTVRLMKMMEDYLPKGAEVKGIGQNDANPSFPVNVAQREIVVARDGATYRFPAGSLARDMCNYTFLDPASGVVRQNTAGSLQRAISEMA